MQNNMIMNMLLNKLKQQNPQGYTQIQQWMSSGQDPQKIINTLLQSGQISQKDINSAQGMLNQIKNTNSKNRF